MSFAVDVDSFEDARAFARHDKQQQVFARQLAVDQLHDRQQLLVFRVIISNYLCLCRSLPSAAAVILVEFINGDQPLLQRLGVGNRHRGDGPVRKQEFRAFRVR